MEGRAGVKIFQTKRGFDIAEFTDLYGLSCSIQKSSLATSDALWLGVDTNREGEATPRMHLSQDMVKELLPLLRRFAKTGDIK